MNDSPFRKHEPLIFSGILVLAAALRIIPALSHEDPALLMASLGSLVIALVLFVLIWRNIRVALLICGIYMLLSGALGAFSAVVSLMSPEMFPTNLIITAYAAICLFGGYRLVRIWKATKPA